MPLLTLGGPLGNRDKERGGQRDPTPTLSFCWAIYFKKKNSVSVSQKMKISLKKNAPGFITDFDRFHFCY